jgi:hypothetical protein
MAIPANVKQKTLIKGTDILKAILLNIFLANFSILTAHAIITALPLLLPAIF